MLSLAILTVDFCCVCRAHSEALQKKSITFLMSPASPSLLTYLLHTLLADARHLVEPSDVCLYPPDGVRSKCPNNKFGELRTDAFHQSAAVAGGISLPLAVA